MTEPGNLDLSTTLRPIEDVAGEAGLLPQEAEPYGRHAGKLSLSLLDRLADRPLGRAVVVTGITPTSLGEGKTTTAIGLVQGLARIGSRAMLCLREPSVGPVFGAKGGGTGGGRSQVVPMEDINLHFTGDFHAVAAAHNLLAAALDASLHHGNPLAVEPRTVTWSRALDVNDRALRHVLVGLGGKPHGIPRESGFIITAASEVMAILTMSTGLADMRERLGRIVVGETGEGRQVTADDLGVAGAMAVLLRHAVRPNLAQTIEGRPALVHAGPFGNIATGNNSVLADRMALMLADVMVTESGFGSDLGFEKFCHLMAPAAGIHPSAAVIVASVRALRMHGGLTETQALAGPDQEALERGCANLAAHIDNVHAFGLPTVVAVNRIEGDADSEIDLLVGAARDMGADEVAVTDGFARGGAGAEELGKAVLAALERPASFTPINPPGTPIRQQVERLATRVYGADAVEFSPTAERTMGRLEEQGLGELPVCMAKTHLSLSHDPMLKARPRGFTFPVRDLVASVGAGYVVVLCGDQMLMPGLGREPAFRRMDVDDQGRVTGLS
jgi:formate--tetrahydrofolate ligase